MKLSLLVLFLFILITLKSQARYDLIIDEIMIDPSPAVGLPNYEWIEIKNISANPINVKGWRLVNEDGQSGTFPAYDLKPDSFLIICGNSAFTSMQTFGPTLNVPSFPSLDNALGLIALQSSDGRTIHSVNYSDDWYKNDLKKDGGWAMEMIDTRHACAGTGNWKASVAETGGSPGKVNSISENIIDEGPPRLLNAWFTDSIHIILQFDKQLDSATAANVSNYSAETGLTFTSVEDQSPFLDRVQLLSSSVLETNKVYLLSVRNLMDCATNTIDDAESIKIGRPSDPVKGDWIINEILFDPKPDGYDFIELYNNSESIFDAARLYISNRNSSGALTSIKVLSSNPHYIFPGDYIVVTEDVSSLERNYLVRSPEHVIKIASLASFPDDEGNAVALNFQGEIVDELKYNKSWHFKLIANAEGVSLERIDPSSPTQDPGNWHSASSTAGYATPTYSNSQFKNIDQSSSQIDIQPKTISPDGDGFNDVVTISYAMKEPGYIANINIFDAMGRPVKILVANALLGMNGHWNWDGLNDRGAKLLAGVYVVLIELFNLNGKKSKFKKVIILAGAK